MNSFSNNLNMNQNLATPGFIKNSLYTNNSSNNKIFNFNNNFDNDITSYTFSQKNLININKKNNPEISSPFFLEQTKDINENSNKFNLGNFNDFKSNSNRIIHLENNNLLSIKPVNNNNNNNNINNNHPNYLINDIIRENDSDNNEENEDENEENNSSKNSNKNNNNNSNNFSDNKEIEDEINSEDEFEDKISSEHSKHLEPIEFSSVNFESENKRMTLEYIKILGLETKLFSKVNIENICEENNISKDFILNGNEYYENLKKNIEINKKNENKIIKFDFDMDFILLNNINLDKNMELICFISIPRIICMNNKLYLFQITPNINFIESFLIFKFPEKLEKIIYKFSIKFLKCCFRKNKNTFSIQIVNEKTFNILTYDIITKLELECENYVNGINILIRNYNNIFI